MNNKETSWRYSYAPTSGLSRASYIQEPILINRNTSSYKGDLVVTEKEAIDKFSNLLGNHVEAIINKASSLCDNKTLRKRLLKYGNHKAIKKLDIILQTIKDLEKL